MQKTKTHIGLALAMALLVAACQAPATTTPAASQGGATVSGGKTGTIKGTVRVDAGTIDAAALRLLQATSAGGGRVVATCSGSTHDTPIGPDGSFSVTVPGGYDYTLEATVPDGRGGVTRVVTPTPITVPLAEDPPIVDAASLVTRRTGSIQGLIELVNGKAGESPEGADVFLSGGTSVVGKAGETGRFALTNVAEGTWNVIISKPGFKRARIDRVAVRAGRPSLLDTPVKLEAESAAAAAGVRGSVQTTDGKAVIGATVSAFPVDRALLVGFNAGLDNFTAITDETGTYELLALPPGAYTVQVYRPFYQVPPRRSVTVTAGPPQELGITKLVSTVAYFGKVTGQVLDDKGQPLSGAVAQLDPPVTDQQFSDANGKFTLDRILPGEYKLTVAAGGFKPAIIPVLVDNKQNFVADLGTPIGLIAGNRSDAATVIIPGVPRASGSDVTPAIPATPGGSGATGGSGGAGGSATPAVPASPAR